MSPGHIVHILQKNLIFLGANESIILAVFNVKVIIWNLFSKNLAVVVVNVLDCVGNKLFDTLKGEPEGIDRTLKTFEHQNTHQPADTHLSAFQG